MVIKTLDNDIKVIIRDIVNSMTFKICIEDTEIIDDQTFKITTCNTQHLRKCSIVTVNDQEYIIDDFVQDEYLIMTGGSLITECFDLPNPYFLSGTPQLASTELLQLKSDLSRFPFVWLPQVFSSRYVTERETSYTSSRLRLFIFDFADNKEWLDQDHEVNVIRPMKALTDNFLMALQKYKNSGRIENYETFDRSNFGDYKDKRGNVSSILPENLSGVELLIEIPIFVQENCKKNNCK